MTGVQELLFVFYVIPMLTDILLGGIVFLMGFANPDLETPSSLAMGFTFLLMVIPIINILVAKDLAVLLQQQLFGEIE